MIPVAGFVQGETVSDRTHFPGIRRCGSHIELCARFRARLPCGTLRQVWVQPKFEIGMIGERERSVRARTRARQANLRGGVKGRKPQDYKGTGDSAHLWEV